ncbi:MAG: type II/IV secretion system protein [Candidatus Levybacteria bacterium]|nr:type II/IV secretion system protein [Candidatus Levybacteria bacterium]
MGLTDDQLKKILLQSKLLDDKGIAELAEAAKDAKTGFIDALLGKGVITDENLGVLTADFLKVPFVSLSKITIPENVLTIVPERFARKHKVVPFARDQKAIRIAMADPTRTDIIEMVFRKTGQMVIPHLATAQDIHNAFGLYRRDIQKSFDTLIATQAGISFTSANAPTERIVDLIINYAYQDKASDIHIEPEEKDSLVRFRVDGILHDVLVMPKSIHDQIITRIKVLSKLRTDEHLSPQDGKMRHELAEESLDIRVSVIPIVDGEKAELRLLSSKFRVFSLLELGMNERDLELVKNSYSKAYGMILSTGPTGSGKTTTIYAILKHLNIRSKNITTIEDPVEYRIQGVNQIQVNTKTNLTFANGLRSILRQDPNIVFVGEIRDNETAGIAVNAALTGHLVLSTMHTNDAATALPRLADMDIEPFLVASTVTVIIAQRLMRRICEICKTETQVARENLAKNLPNEIFVKHFGNSPIVKIYRGTGCRICHQTGFQGRVGAFEVLEVSNEIRKLITRKEDSDTIAKQAVAEGMTTMLDNGLDKVVKGVTTIEEVLRVTKVESL